LPERRQPAFIKVSICARKSTLNTGRDRDAVRDVEAATATGDTSKEEKEAANAKRALRGNSDCGQIEEQKVPPLWGSHGCSLKTCSEMGLRGLQFHRL